MLFKSLFKGKSDSRKLLFFLVTIYSIILVWGFIVYIVPQWGYFGMDYKPMELGELTLPVLFSIIPMIWMPLKLNRPTMFAYWLLYLFTYIPMIVGVCIDSKFESHNRIIISFAYLFGFALINCSYFFSLINFKTNNLSSKYFWIFFYTITFSMFIYVVLIFKDSLSFVDILSSVAVYDLRSSGQKIQNESVFAGYFIMWLSNALFPFLIAVGLVQKQKIKFWVGVVGMIVMYMTMANKQYLFSIILMFIIYRLFKAKSNLKITKFLIYLIIPAAFLIYSQTLENSVQELFFPLSGIFLLRTIYTSSFMSVYYNLFFENHPYIYFSHISGINKFVDYPYKNQLGVEVGSNFTSFTDYNANANFFITDGLSSIGLFGILLMGIICALVFIIFDSLAKKLDLILPILLITNSTVALMNVSLFTTLLSGGLLFYMLLMSYGKNIIESSSKKVNT